jgi:hypothetical protein
MSLLTDYSIILAQLAILLAIVLIIVGFVLISVEKWGGLLIIASGITIAFLWRRFNSYYSEIVAQTKRIIASRKLKNILGRLQWNELGVGGVGAYYIL